MDETRIDAAPTPAHVFAYRAFRSVFVHSPESSPLRPLANPNDEKENTNLSPVQNSKFTTSSSISKRKGSEKDALTLTPKRQKTIAISPAKSILKNPNAPTPRRASLRDITVTFKDLRNSVSPELARGGSVAAKLQPQPGLRVVSEPVITVKPHSSSVQLKESSKQVRAVSGPVLLEDRYRTAIAEMVQDPAFDLSDYVAKTEKEVRRFIAYASKWKKQAQEKEEENMKLKKSLEEAQRKYDRLRQEMALKEKEREVYDIQPTSNESSERVVREEVERNSERRQTSNTAFDHKTKKPASDIDMKDPRYSSLRLAKRSAVPAQIDRSKSQKPQSPQKSEEWDPDAGVRAELFNVIPPVKPPHHRNPGSDRTVHRAVTKPVSPKPHERHQIEMVLPLRSASTNSPVSAHHTSIPHDRKAAARERLRQKAEGRKASMRLSVAQEGPETGKKEGFMEEKLSGNDEEDESELDWADLG